MWGIIHMRTSDGAFTNQALAEAKQAQKMVNFLNSLGNTFIQENGTVCVLTRPPGEKDHWPLPPIKAGWHSSFSP